MLSLAQCACLVVLIQRAQSDTKCELNVPKFPRCEDSSGIYKKEDEHGHLCPPDENPEHPCKPIDSWCNVKFGSLFPKYQCSRFDNSMFSSCFTWDFSLELKGKGRKVYKFVKAAVDWPVAEAFCQAHNSHLVNLDTQQEADLLRDMLLFPHNMPNKWSRNSSFTFSDPMNAVCNTIEGKHNRNPLVWLGLYYDFKSKQWINSDGTNFEENIKIGRSHSFDLGYFFNMEKYSFKHNPSYWTWDVVWGAHFVTRDRFPKLGEDSYSTEKEGNAILCEKHSSPPSVRWEGKFASDSDKPKCLTGFYCPGKCLIGSDYDNSQLCDGVKDCPDGEDEKLENCPHFNQKLDGGRRTYVFLPNHKNYAEKVNICNVLGLNLPTIRSESDIETLKTMSQKFGNSRSHKDFSFQLQMWNQSDSDVEFIPLGRTLGQLTWPDGTDIKFTQLKNETQAQFEENIPGEENVEKMQQFVALTLSETSDAEEFIVKSTNDQHRSYTICEGDSEAVVISSGCIEIGHRLQCLNLFIMFTVLSMFYCLNFIIDSNYISVI